MKLIGIMGNAGSGKTTFTEHLDKRKNVGVIHVDNLVGNIKRKYFKLFLQKKENNTTPTTKANPKLKSRWKNLFYKNKFLFKILMTLRSKLVEKELNKQIEEFKRDGKKVIAIDDWALPYHKKIFSRLDNVYTIERNYLTRRDGLKKRDDLTLNELKIYDLPYALNFIIPPTGKNTKIIKNNGTIKELQDKADTEYEELGELTFDERYTYRSKVETLVNSLSKVVSPRVSEETRIDK